MGVRLSLTNPNPVFLWKQRRINRYEDCQSIMASLGGWRLRVKRVKIEDTEHRVSLNNILCSNGIQGISGYCVVVLCSEMRRGEGKKQTPCLSAFYVHFCQASLSSCYAWSRPGKDLWVDSMTLWFCRIIDEEDSGSRISTNNSRDWQRDCKLYRVGFWVRRTFCLV